MLHSEVDPNQEQQEPSVDSDNAEDRIKARRLRIQARVEAAKRNVSGEKEVKPKPLSEADKEALRKSRKQIDHSRQRIDKLKSDGTELVTSVGVAADARETTRRLDDDEGKKARMEKLTAEAKASEEKFEEIMKKWETSKPPEAQQLHKLLMSQKSSCDAMIDEKNKLITELQQELKMKDDQYVKDLKQQAEDVDIMIERMEEQIKTLMKAYRDELNEVEESFRSERRELVASQTQKWESLMQQRREQEEEYMKTRQMRVEEFDDQLQHLRVQDAEEYNRVKIKMETDVQTLEQQLQSMKATFQLNAEKLDYNFQVLKKRDEENTITKSQQKRKITRLQDALNNLRTKLTKLERTFREENLSLTEDYRRLSAQFQKLQEKSKHFQMTDMKRFVDIWRMNEEQALELRQKVLDADCITHEQQLGLKWEAPPPFESALVGVTVGRASGGGGGGEGLSASQAAAKAFSDADSDAERGRASDLPADISTPRSRPTSPATHPQPTTAAEASRIPSKTLKRALELICDESGFLVERKLMDLLAPLDKDEQSLMTLDSIFKALGVETEDDVHQLVSYFVTAALDGETEEILIERSDSQISGSVDEGTESLGSRLSLAGSMDLIHPNDALKALKQFSEDHEHSVRAQSKKQLVKLKTQVSAPANREISLDPTYWERIAMVISPEKERMWDGMLVGFERYSRELQERATLIQETESLGRQNTELRMLLNQYLMSRINLELEVPPTKTLPVEVVNQRAEYA